MFKSLCRPCRLTKGRCITLLVIINISLGIYTLPLLINFEETSTFDTSDYNIAKRDTLLKEQTELNSSLYQNWENSDYEAHEFFYINQPTTGCEGDSPFLLIAVCSSFHHFDRRQAIRQTWASVIHKHRLSTKLVFMLGAPSDEFRPIQVHVDKENQMYGDIIQEDFIDSYVNLTVKSVGVLKWSMTFCQGLKYLMKTDDDSFINIANLITFLMDITTGRGSKPDRFMIGSLITNAKPLTNRSSKWFSPEVLFKDKIYPDYLSGSAYVITGNSIEYLYSATTVRRLFWLEDIFITGMLSRDLDIPLFNDVRFTYVKPKLVDPCFYNAVVSAHGLTTSDLHDIWIKLHSLGLDCVDYLDKLKSRRTSHS